MLTTELLFECHGLGAKKPNAVIYSVGAGFRPLPR
jgi:hypothetical protein